MKKLLIFILAYSIPVFAAEPPKGFIERFSDRAKSGSRFLGFSDFQEDEKEQTRNQFIIKTLASNAKKKSISKYCKNRQVQDDSGNSGPVTLIWIEQKNDKI